MLFLLAPVLGLLGRWVDDHAKAVRGLLAEVLFDVEAWYGLGFTLEVPAGLGGVWWVDGEDDGAGGATDGFKELVDDIPVDDGTHERSC